MTDLQHTKVLDPEKHHEYELFLDLFSGFY